MSSSKDNLYIIKEAMAIVESAKKENVTLRIMGATAFRIHCLGQELLYDALGREISDLDFAGYGKDRRRIERLISSLNYESSHGMLGDLTHPDRVIFFNPSKNLTTDVFLDQLSMCHTINFKGRLEVDYPTIPLTELLLEKMQIVKINEKDLKDTLILFLEHDSGNGDSETINTKLISSLLSDDWGFYYTVTTNLEKVISYLSATEMITEPQKRLIEQRIRRLLEAIENQPKSLKWKMRAKVGNRKKWYADVEEVER